MSRESFSRSSLGALQTSQGDPSSEFVELVESALTEPASLSIAVAASPAALNLSAEGTLDWYAHVVSARPKALAPGVLHSKIDGGWISDSFEWIFGGQGGALALGAGSGNPAKTTTGTDSTATSALAADGSGTYLFVQSSVINNFGFRFRVPAVRTTRRLKLYTDQVSAQVTVTARLDDGSAAPVSASQSSASNVEIDRCWTIDYCASGPCDLVVTARVTQNNAAAGVFVNIGFLAATLGVP